MRSYPIVRSLFFAGVGFLVSVPVAANAQSTPSTPSVPNLIRNPSFEQVQPSSNPWYGTTERGALRVPQAQLPVLTQGGAISDVPMPASVAAADLNGDKLTDLMVASPVGYYFVYFNSGTPQEPKFTRAELLPVYLSRLRPNDPDKNLVVLRYGGNRIHLEDLNNNGVHSLIIGNYMGEIMMLRNQGSSQVPDFRQPRSINEVIVPTSKDGGRRWGNVFAPTMWDFDGDGRKDLLIGEGSFSANSIHFLQNEGNNMAPKFSDGNRHFLAFGMGREQLTPAVVDYDGNGQPDLLVADRSGRIALYSSSIVPSEEVQADNRWVGGRQPPVGKWKPGDTLDFVTNLTVGGPTGKEMNFGGISTVAAADFTGDGLFDLVVGRTNGTIMFVKNEGTKTEPKFANPVELQGEPTPPLSAPRGWEIGANLSKGNFLATINVVDAAEGETFPDGKKALRISYAPSINQIIKTPFQWGRDITGGTNDEPVNPGSIPNTYLLTQRDLRLENGATYTLSFRVRGQGATRGRGAMITRASRKMKEDEVIRGARGSAQVIRGTVDEQKQHGFTFNVSGGWMEVKREFRVTFDNPVLNDTAAVKTASGSLEIMFTVAPPNGEILFDNFKLEKR